MFGFYTHIFTNAERTEFAIAIAAAAAAAATVNQFNLQRILYYYIIFSLLHHISFSAAYTQEIHTFIYIFCLIFSYSVLLSFTLLHSFLLLFSLYTVYCIHPSQKITT